MLPERMREALRRKVAEYFDTEDERLESAALRLQDGGYADTEVINILKGAFLAGFDEGRKFDR